LLVGFGLYNQIILFQKMTKSNINNSNGQMDSSCTPPLYPMISYIAFYIVGISGLALLFPMVKMQSYVPAIFHVGVSKTIVENIHVVDYRSETYTLSNGDKVSRNFIIWAVGTCCILSIISGLLLAEIKVIKFLFRYDFVKDIETYNMKCKVWKNSDKSG
jgi:hypothetical protein